MKKEVMYKNADGENPSGLLDLLGNFHTDIAISLTAPTMIGLGLVGITVVAFYFLMQEITK